MIELADLGPGVLPTLRPLSSGPAAAELTVTVRISAGGGQSVELLATRFGDLLRAALDELPDLASEIVVPAPRADSSAPSLRIHVPSRTVRLRGVELELTRLEFELLLYLARSPNRVCTRRELLTEVWQTSGTSRTRTMDVHIRRLRDKVGAGTPLITTVRGVGYRIDRAASLVVEDRS
ncbi:MAG TPA: winged helix-turn-helix domain-containing protein [Pseudonocardiaceae bacterium]|nr:winged helix-turn-helix domain-containing protein [Pseudonocardiaceae bacterium]